MVIGLGDADTLARLEILPHLPSQKHRPPAGNDSLA
jgi:hypothetical protein